MTASWTSDLVVSSCAKRFHQLWESFISAQPSNTDRVGIFFRITFKSNGQQTECSGAVFRPRRRKRCRWPKTRWPASTWCTCRCACWTGRCCTCRRRPGTWAGSVPAFTKTAPTSEQVRFSFLATAIYWVFPIGSYRFLLDLFKSYWFLWLPMGSYGFLWVFMGSYGFLLVPIDSCWLQVFNMFFWLEKSLDFTRVTGSLLLVLIGSFGFLWVFNVFFWSEKSWIIFSV